MATLRIPVGAADHAQGETDARVTLVEYGDYQCPYCGQAYPIVKTLQKNFAKQLRFVFRNFPLRELHPWAEAAAETAEFAAGAQKFWPMHDLLFENQKRFGESLFVKLGQNLGLNGDQLQEALVDGRFTEKGSA